MFQFTAFALTPGVICLFKLPGCPIRIPVDQPLPAGPHHVSSLATSFLAIRSLRHPPDALLLRTTIRFSTRCVSYSLILLPPEGGSLIITNIILANHVHLSLQVKEQDVRLTQRANRTRSLNKRQHQTLLLFWGTKTRKDRLQKGGVPAAPSGTATLLRLSPSHRVYPDRNITSHFRSPQFPWLDGRCVQGPGTYSPRHG